MGHLLSGILDLPPLLVLALAFLLPAAEASIFLGFLVPGETGIVLAGVLANQHKLPLWAVLTVAVTGAVIGDSIGFLVGRRYGEQILRHLPKRLLDEDKIKRAEQIVRRWGGRAVFLGRFTATLRALVPGTAGMSGIPYPTFLLWNVIGGTLSATTHVMIGYLAGSQYAHIVKYGNYIGAAVVIGIIIVMIIRLRRSRTTVNRSRQSSHLPQP